MAKRTVHAFSTNNSSMRTIYRSPIAIVIVSTAVSIQRWRWILLPARLQSLAIFHETLDGFRCCKRSFDLSYELRMRVAYAWFRTFRDSFRFVKKALIYFCRGIIWAFSDEREESTILREEDTFFPAFFYETRSAFRCRVWLKSA